MLGYLYVEELMIIVNGLCRLYFYPDEIALLFDKSPQSITNMKSAVNNKLFGTKSAGRLNDNLKLLDVVRGERILLLPFIN